MAVTKVPAGSVLRLELQTGVDEGGNPVIRNRNLSNAKPAALDQDLYDVATSLSGLQEYTLSGISRVDSASLVNA
jgi:hypothetical protein